MNMYKSSLPMIGLAVDVETTGSDWGGDSSINYQGISFGAIAFNTRTFEPIEEMYMEIKFDEAKYKWTKEAEAIHGLSREHLAQFGLDREDAAIKLAEFIFKYCGVEPVVLLSHNTRFDEAFVKQLLGDFGIPFRSHPCQLDTAGMSFICLGLNRSDRVFDFFGLGGRVFHYALEDARLTLQVAKTYHDIFKELFT